MENKLGDYIRKLRGNKSLRDFANLCGISHTHLDSLEKGYDFRSNKRVSPTLDTLNKIAKGAGIDPRVLYEISFSTEIENRFKKYSMNLEYSLKDCYSRGAFYSLNDLINKIRLSAGKLLDNNVFLSENYSDEGITLRLYRWLNSQSIITFQEEKILCNALDSSLYLTDYYVDYDILKLNVSAYANENLKDDPDFIYSVLKTEHDLKFSLLDDHYTNQQLDMLQTNLELLQEVIEKDDTLKGIENAIKNLKDEITINALNCIAQNKKLSQKKTKDDENLTYFFNSVSNADRKTQFKIINIIKTAFPEIFDLPEGYKHPIGFIEPAAARRYYEANAQFAPSSSGEDPTDDEIIQLANELYEEQKANRNQ